MGFLSGEEDEGLLGADTLMYSFRAQVSPSGQLEPSSSLFLGQAGRRKT